MHILRYIQPYIASELYKYQSSEFKLKTLVNVIFTLAPVGSPDQSARSR